MRTSLLWITQRVLANALAILFPASLAAQNAMIPWLTRSADNSRSGWNSHETLLTQQNIAAKGLIRLPTIPVYGDARGMEAQPLILPQVQTARGTHDVMVLPSMADVVRGVDAHDGSAIWESPLGTPLTGSNRVDMWWPNINQNWGCMSTGVIDPDLKRLFQVCFVIPNAQGAPLPAAPASTDPTKARYFMFVLNVTDGSFVTAPILVAGQSNGQDFTAQPRKQRASLVETSVNGLKTVFGCSGTFAETGNGAAGWCFAFDVATNKITAMLATATSGEGAGIWMAGQGPAADSDGNLYLITGNGDFDGVREWGESFLKIHYSPPSGSSQASLKVIDHWTPWTDLARAGQNLPANKLSGVSAPSNPPTPVGGNMDMASLKGARLVGKVNDQNIPVLLVYPQMPDGTWGDEDWGSAGPACVFSVGVCIAAGKDGIAYAIKTNFMGGTTVGDLKNPKQNCAKLSTAPVWLTMSPGDVDPCPTDPTTLNFFPWGVTAHLHMTPVQFFDPVLKSWTIFAWGENSQLHKWALSSSGQLNYVAQGNEFASPNVRTIHQGGPNSPLGGMPGGFCSGSSNGTDPNSALLVCTVPYGNANQQVTTGRLLVYDPVHLAPDGSLKVLWDSQQWAIQFSYNKFDPPVIDGGQIYVPNYNGGVDVYRLNQ